MENDLETGIEIIAERLRNSRSAIAFTGAGISTESGIPDFRSPGGVWSKNRTVYFEEFLNSAEDRHEYWRQKSQTHIEFEAATPNAGHKVLADWESSGKLNGIVTQNIDGLHQTAGSQNVHELHGTAREISCLNCNERWPADPWVQKYLRDDLVPDCPKCGGLLKHATVSFGQSLSSDTLNASTELAKQADLCFALGSSLVVYPAAAVPEHAKSSGAFLVIINQAETPLDTIADVVLHQPLGETLRKIHAAYSS